MTSLTVPHPSWLQAWWPLALSRELSEQQPLARQLLGEAIVLFRDETGLAVALPDRCPHRLAPLSCGKVSQGTLACPYHGWQFSGRGQCVKVPGLERSLSATPVLTPLLCQEQAGLVWVCLASNQTLTELPQATPVLPALLDGVDSFWLTASVNCELADAAENFLDGTHTHFVHAGWLRHDQARQLVSAEVRPLADGVEARYGDESVQSGFISRWLEGQRSASFGRFRFPCLAEIEYQSLQGLNLLASAYLTPTGTGTLLLHARIATRQGRLPAWCKRWVLTPLFRQILKQDQQILERTAAHQQRFSGALPALKHTELDLLGPAIRHLLAGGAATDIRTRQQRLWL